MPNAYCAALIRAAASCAEAGVNTNTQRQKETEQIKDVLPILMMFFVDEMRRIPLDAWQRFFEDRLWIGVESQRARIHDPRFDQYIGILYRCLPGQRVALTADPLNDM